MLTWVGKRPLSTVKAYPAQHIESFDAAPAEFENSSEYQNDWPDRFEAGGLLFHGDNKDVLAHLLANGFRGKVKLIYIDPPFDSGADYVRKVQLRGASGTTKVDGEEYTLGEQIQYEDIWANDNYLQFMYERLLMLKELLAEDGTLVVHCDYRRSHELKIILEEIFSTQNFISEVVWKRSQPRGNVSKGLSVAHDTLLFFAKTDNPYWDPQYLPISDSYIQSHYRLVDEETGRIYRLDNMISPNPNRPNLDYEWNGVRRVWRVTKEKMKGLEAQNRIIYSSTGVAQYKRYLDESSGTPLTTWWDDIDPVNSQAKEREDYPTQKPSILIERILSLTTNDNDIVLDSFIGSGTTAAVAQKLGRRWIGCDINKGAIQTTAKRLHKVMQEQAQAIDDDKQATLVEDENAPPAPAQLSFNTYRVNDYDLQIQHNEAVQLACDYIGVTRKRSDSYFDGTLGNKLVKIIPFNHPLSPLDLDDCRKEIERRPEEERHITIVCLGLELKARAWVEDYNRNRPINKINIIELRSDRKYGGFIKHEPMVASVSVKRLKDKLKITINDVYSPSIVQRLNMDDGLFRAQIDDWRAVVDCVMIDLNYDGEVFNVALSDTPARKQDLVEGEYELKLPPNKSIVAIKIIDMLGEEIIITETP